MSAAPLDATANVPGTFKYSSPIGTVLDVGSKPLSAMFTPTDMADYSMASIEMPITVNPTVLTVSGITANSKTYDNTTQATLNLSNAQLQGVIGSDQASLFGGTGTFASQNVGNGIVVTVSGLMLSGKNAYDYTVTPPKDATAKLTPAALTVSGVTAKNKVYDGTTTATLALK